MNLFTLTIRRKRLSFARDGKETVTYVNEVRHGLPAAVVNIWRQLFPAAVVSIDEEKPEIERRSRRRTFGGKPITKEPKVRTHDEGDFHIVGSDGYGEAIDAAMRDDKGDKEAA